MEPRKRIYDLYAVQSATERIKQMVDIIQREADRMSKDQEKDKREKALQCLYCYYRRGVVAGQAFTQWACARCNTEQSHANTAVPCLCNDCAKETGLCVSCLASRDGKQVKKLP